MSEPQCVMLPNGTQEWRVNGKLHREDGPAKILADGSQLWYRDGRFHREDGPAIVEIDGRQDWCRDGKLHREDGPAVEKADGSKFWYRAVNLFHRWTANSVNLSVVAPFLVSIGQHDRGIINNAHTPSSPRRT